MPYLNFFNGFEYDPTAVCAILILLFQWKGATTHKIADNQASVGERVDGGICSDFVLVGRSGF